MYTVSRILPSLNVTRQGKYHNSWPPRGQCRPMLLECGLGEKDIVASMALAVGSKLYKRRSYMATLMVSGPLVLQQKPGTQIFFFRKTSVSAQSSLDPPGCFSIKARYADFLLSKNRIMAVLHLQIG
jgi:hypothetical protein